MPRPPPTVEVYQTTPDGWEYHGGSWRRAVTETTTMSTRTTTPTPTRSSSSLSRSLSPSPRGKKKNHNSRWYTTPSTTPRESRNDKATNKANTPTSVVSTPETVLLSSPETSDDDNDNDDDNECLLLLPSAVKKQQQQQQQNHHPHHPHHHHSSGKKLLWPAVTATAATTTTTTATSTPSPTSTTTTISTTMKNPIPVEHIHCIQRAFGGGSGSRDNTNNNNNNNSYTKTNNRTKSVDLHRDVFQVDPDATDREIRIAYFRRGRQTLTYHDNYHNLNHHKKKKKNTTTTASSSSSSSSLAAAMVVLNDIEEQTKFTFQAISMAFEILTTPEWRQVYEACHRDLLSILLLPPAATSTTAQAEEEDVVGNEQAKQTCASPATVSITTTTTAPSPPLQAVDSTRPNSILRQQQQQAAAAAAAAAATTTDDCISVQSSVGGGGGNSSIKSVPSSNNSTSRGRIRWNENVEELLYRQDPEETDFKRSKSPTSEESSALLLQGLLEDEKKLFAAAKTKNNNNIHNIKQRKKKKKKQVAAVVIDAMELAQQLEQLDKSFVSDILNNVESGLDGLESKFDDFVSFARSVGGGGSSSGKRRATSSTTATTTTATTTTAAAVSGTMTTTSEGDNSDQAIVADENAMIVVVDDTEKEQEQQDEKKEEDSDTTTKTIDKKNTSTTSTGLLRPTSDDDDDDDYVENIEVDYIEKPRIFAKLESTPPPPPQEKEEEPRRYNATMEQFRPKPQPREFPSFEHHQLPRKRFEARAAAAAARKNTPTDDFGTPVTSNRSSSFQKKEKVAQKMSPVRTSKVFDNSKDAADDDDDDNDSVARDLFANLTKPTPAGFKKVRSRSLPDNCWITSPVVSKPAGKAEFIDDDGEEEEKVNLSQLFDEDPFADLLNANSYKQEGDISNSFMVNNSFMGDSDVTPEVLSGASAFEDIPLKPKRLDDSFSSASTAVIGTQASSRPTSIGNSSMLASVVEAGSREEQVTKDSPEPPPSSEPPAEEKPDATAKETTTSLTKSSDSGPPTSEKMPGIQCDDTFLSYVGLYWNSLAKEVNSLHRDLTDFSTRLGNEVSSNLQQANEVVMASLNSIHGFEEEKSKETQPSVQLTHTF